MWLNTHSVRCRCIFWPWLWSARLNCTLNRLQLLQLQYSNWHMGDHHVCVAPLSCTRNVHNVYFPVFIIRSIYALQIYVRSLFTSLFFCACHTVHAHAFKQISLRPRLPLHTYMSFNLSKFTVHNMLTIMWIKIHGCRVAFFWLLAPVLLKSNTSAAFNNKADKTKSMDERARK